MPNYKIEKGKLVPIKETEPNTKSIIENKGDTLTIIDTKTGKIIRKGTSSNDTGLPSIAPPSEEQANEFYKNNPENLNIDENLLRKELSKKGTQTISRGFMQVGATTGANIKLALEALSKPKGMRTQEEQAEINRASQTSDQYNSALREKTRQQLINALKSSDLRKQNFGIKSETTKDYLEQVTSDEARQNARSGKISGGFQMEGQIIQDVGKKVKESNFLQFPSFADFLPFYSQYKKTKNPEKFLGSTIQGFGETVEQTGDLIESASHKESYEKLFGTAKQGAEYFVNVGKKGKLSIEPSVNTPFFVKPKFTPDKQTQKELGEAGLIGASAIGTAVTNFSNNPIEESGKLIGSGVFISGATSMGNKLIGLGKAGISTLKGGKYVPYEQLYETNPKNLLKGKYKKGTPKSTIKEFSEGSNPKQTMHSTGNDFFNGKTKTKVIAPKFSPPSDPPALFASTGKANETYLRINGSNTYNPTPRIPFINTPLKSKPSTYRLIGTTKPKRLVSIKKFNTLEKGKQVFNEANISKNIPLTSPANELAIKGENEVIFRPNTVLTKKGIKGTNDFTFVKGTFVETPRVRVMPSNPRTKISISSPKKVIVNNTKPVKVISFESSLNASRNPQTVYNILPLFKSKVSSMNNGVSSIVSTSKKIFSSNKSSSNNSFVRPSYNSVLKTSSNSTSSKTTLISTSRRSSKNSGNSSSNIISTSQPSYTSTPKKPLSRVINPPKKNPLIYKPSLLYKQSNFMSNAPSLKYKVKNIISLKKVYKKAKKIRLI